MNIHTHADFLALFSPLKAIEFVRWNTLGERESRYGVSSVISAIKIIIIKKKLLWFERERESCIDSWTSTVPSSSSLLETELRHLGRPS